MTTSTADRLVEEYLSRLTDAARQLAPDRRSELIAEIREHIAASRAGATGKDEADVRTMLDRLGEPADIVAAALDDGQPEPPPQAAQRRPWLVLEVAAVLMLTVGALIPLVGWAVGVILLWSSGWWRRSEKLLGTFVVPGGAGLALLLMGMPTLACTDGSTPGDGGPANDEMVCSGFALPPWLGTPLLAYILLAPIVVGAVLFSRARARAGRQDY